MTLSQSKHNKTQNEAPTTLIENSPCSDHIPQKTYGDSNKNVEN